MAKNIVLVGILLVMFAAAGVYAYLGYSGSEALSTHYMTEQKWSDSSCGGCHPGTYDEVSESSHVQQNLKEWSSIMDYGVDTASIDENTMAVTYGQVQPGGGYMTDYGVDIDCMICHDQAEYDFEARAESIASGNFENANEAAVQASQKELEKEPLYVAAYMLDVLTPFPLVTEIHDEVNGEPDKALCGGNCHAADAETGAVTWTLADSASYDVHESLNCQDCHATEDHEIGGRANLSESQSIHEAQSGVLDCQSSGCHEGISHGALVDGHLETVSCETCHIPALPGEDTTGTAVVQSFSWKNGVREDVTYDSDFAPTISWSSGVYYDTLPTAQQQTNSSLLKPFNVITGTWWDEGIDAEVLADPDNSSSIGNPISPADVLNADTNGDGNVTADEIRSYDGNGDGTPDYPNAVLRTVEMYYQVSHNIVSTSVGLDDPLVCADCHGATATAINWTALGYEKDPAETDPPTDFSTKTIEVTTENAKPTEVEREPAL